MTTHYIPLNETHYTIPTYEDSVKYGIVVRATLEEGTVTCSDCLNNMEREGVA